MEKLTANKQDVINCFNRAPQGSDAREILKHLFGDDVFKFDYKTITNEKQNICAAAPSIYTVAENVETITGINHNALLSARALYQLLTIQDAVNDGWKQKYNDMGWYPYWVLYTQNELDGMGEKKRKENGIRLLSGVSAVNAEYAGVRGANADYRGTLSGTYLGFPLCIKSQEMALWMGKKYEHLFFAYCGLTLKEEE